MSETFTTERHEGSGERGGPRRRGKFSRFGKRGRTVEPEEPLDYKNVAYLERFLTPTGKIHSRKRTSFSGQDQRKLAAEIKLARFMGLLPYSGQRYDR
jgi:small subunit ribosomal protein S18